MIKTLMSLVAVFTSFFGMLGLNSSSALATPIVNQVINQSYKSIASSYLKEPVNLNFSGSLWQLNNQDAKNIFDHLGCSCADCSLQAEKSN
jgi:hypothetical protein